MTDYRDMDNRPRRTPDGEAHRRPQGDRPVRRSDGMDGHQGQRPQGQRPQGYESQGHPQQGRRPQQDPRRRAEAARRREEAIRRDHEEERQKKRKQTKLILLLVEVLILLGLVGAFWLFRTTTKMQKVKIDEESIVINDAVAENVTLKGYRNIALFGVDARDKSLGKGNRTDTIIICSINEDTGDIKLCSVFRDTYLNLGNDSYNKCNAAYAKGGPEQAINMLNMNLDLNITDYVTVGFTGLIDVIDGLGGVEIDVTEEEISHLNNYQISMVGKTNDDINFYADEGKDYIAVKSPGRQKLNGLQATAYCRIRYVGNDFMRTWRQRTVLQEIMKVAKKSSLSDLNKVLNKVMPNVSTSLDVDEITSLLSQVAKYNVVAEDGFPFESNRTTGSVGSKGSCVIPVNLEDNVKLLQEFLFGNTDYVPSSQVQNYSSKISADTGH